MRSDRGRDTDRHAISVRKHRPHCLRWRALALASAALVSACGGGNGSSNDGVAVMPGLATPSPSPTPVTPPLTAEQLEDQRSSAALAVNAEVVYRAGVTGRGIKIAIIDTGLSPGLSEFSGRTDAASADLDSSRGIADQHGHGTWVSSVALAARDGRGMHGVAYEATLVSLNVTRPATCTPQACPLSSELITRAIDAAVASGARVINLSFNSDYTEENLLAAVRRAVAANAVIVISAGNESADQPLLLSRAIAGAGAGAVIIAGACDAAGRPYAFNNRAGNGAAASSYLMALGVDVNMTGRDGSVVTYSGTSFSTPAISGAAALIAQAKPNLTGAQIVSLLLNNAYDAGPPGRDEMYGNGMLDIGRAFAALGIAG